MLAVMIQFTVDAQPLCYDLSMHIIQITDPHLYGRADGTLRGVETDSTLRVVLEEALAQFPEYAAMLSPAIWCKRMPVGICVCEVFAEISAGPCSAYLEITMNRWRWRANSTPRRFKFAAHRKSADGSSSCWTVMILDTSAAACGPANSLASMPNSRIVARATRWSVYTIIPSRWAAAGSTPSVLRTPTTFGASSRRTLESKASYGDTCIRPMTDGAAACACTPRRRRAPSSCRRATAMRSTALPPAYRSFELHGDGRIDTQVHWVAAASRQRNGRALAAPPCSDRRSARKNSPHCWHAYRYARRPWQINPCIVCGNCTANTTRCICSVPFTCCARATTRWIRRSRTLTRSPIRS